MVVNAARGSVNASCGSTVVIFLALAYCSLGLQILSSSNALGRSSAPSSLSAANLLIHWKGEDIEGYSMQLRHMEFQGALSSILAKRNAEKETRMEMIQQLSYANALNYTGTLDDGYMPQHKLERFNSALQYLQYNTEQVSVKEIQEAVQRCSLIHAAYQTVAEADSYGALSDTALANGAFEDMKPGNKGENDTWCVRVRYYGSEKTEKRHGERTRSLSLERVALEALKPLLSTFGGGVNLKEPNCKLYIMDGLLSSPSSSVTPICRPTKVLAHRLAVGPRVSTIAPSTRLCITNTPLCPIACYCLCNAAEIQPGFKILDPYAGSGAILLAASMILDGKVRSVGIEIAHNGLVNRHDIGRDFETRQLVPPLALLHGDSTDFAVRQEARQVLSKSHQSNRNNDADMDNNEDDQTAFDFDSLITDPPYGIRESTNYNEKRPIQELVASIEEDRRKGCRLLKKGGKLVCFLPCTADECMEEDVLPTDEEMESAGLRLAALQEQPLNDNLSRWLAVFDCVA